MSLVNKITSNSNFKLAKKVVNHKYFYKIFLLLSFVTFLLLSDSKAPQQSKISSLDTHIPPGHVLIPIEVQNYESLDRVLGQYGVVDLYLPKSVRKGRSSLVAKRIKILRSPKDPNYFAVLAPDSRASEIVQNPGPFVVVVQNPKKDGTQIVIRKKNPRRIFIGDEK